MAVYFFYGDEDYNIELELESMKSKLNPDFLAMNYQCYDNPEYQDLITALRTPPMMFGDLLVVVNAEDYFLSNKTFFEDRELADIEDALKNNPDGLNIVFVVRLPRNENKKLDSRRKLYKILSKYNMQEFATFKFYETQKVVDWTIRNAKRKELEINKDAAELLVEQLGNDLRQIDNEIEKLRLIAHPQKTITIKMVEAISISNQDLFNITNSILKNQKDKALLEFKKLTYENHPLKIIAGIQTMLRKWIVLKTKATQMPLAELARQTGQKEYSLQKELEKLKNISASDIVRLKQNLYNVECRIKQGLVIDDIMEVEVALIR